MHLGHIEIFVADPRASQRFYTEVLGFGLVTVQQDRFVWLRSGDVQVLLRPAGAAPDRAQKYQDTTTALVLYTNDLKASLDRLNAAGVPIRGTDGSPNCVTFIDPDGNWFQLVDPKSH